MSMGIYNLPRGKNQNCARLHFIETCNVQTENRNANTAAAVKPTGIKKEREEKKGKKDQFRSMWNTPAPEIIKNLFNYFMTVNMLLSWYKLLILPAFITYILLHL